MWNKLLIYIAIFFNFLGFYVVLLLVANLGLLEISRSLTIPMRMIIIGCLLLIFLRFRKLSNTTTATCFYIFSSLFFLRIILDSIEVRSYYISLNQVFFYFVSFSFIPFVVIRNVYISPNILLVVKKSFLTSGLIFGLLATILYSQYVGTVGRLTSVQVEDEVLSPLILSYCSALIIGIALNLIVTSKFNFKKNILLFILIGLALTPFFLGASRGSILALLLPFVFIVITNRSITKNIKIIVFMFLVFLGLLIFSERFGSGIFNRLFSIGSDIEKGNSSALRVQIWEQSFDQFSYSPLFGDKLEVEGFSIYPHNLFLEVLQTTGFLGFIPFSILIIITFRECYYIFKYYRNFSWIAVVFLQSFTQNMFSGSLFNASWFWFSMAVVLNFRRGVKIYKNTQISNKSKVKIL